jgi:hypothetical protein
MREPGFVACLTFRKRVKKIYDAFEKKQQQRKNGARLNHDGVHLPVRVVERDVHQRLRDAEVRRGTDWQKLRQSFDDAKQNRLNVYVQKASGAQLSIAYTEAVSQLRLVAIDAVNWYTLV